MIIPGSKKPIGIIISKMHKDAKMSEGGEVKNEVEANVRDNALHSHAEDIMSSIHNKSPGDLVRAMKNFLEEHGLHQEQDEDDSSSEATPSK